MNEIIQWARLTDLAPAIAALMQSAPEWMYLERVPSGWLSEDARVDGLRLTAFEQTEDWNAWERGRIFGAAFELRWEKQDSAFQTVYVGAPCALPGFVVDALDLSTARVSEHAYVLWGRRLSAKDAAEMGLESPPGLTTFLEFVAPRVLHYPLDAERLALRVREYNDAQNGALLYSRFVRLEAVDVSL